MRALAGARGEHPFGPDALREQSRALRGQQRARLPLVPDSVRLGHLPGCPEMERN
jgi:hypothetical protein